MTAKFFVDTNVLVYAVSNAVADQPRRDVALELLDRSDLAFSAQVLAEFYSVATTKTKLNLTHDEAVLLLQSLARIPGEPCPSALKRGRDAPSRDVKRTRDAEHDAGQDGHGTRETDHAIIDGDVIGPRQASRHQRQHDARTPDGNRDADDRAT